MLKGLLQLGALAIILSGLGFIAFISHVLLSTPYDGKAEAIVVLTGGQGRVETGLGLLAQSKADHLLISGAHHDVQAQELLMLKGFDKALVARIDLGKAAKDTMGNAEETRAWVKRHKIQSLIVVTAHYHMPRTLLHLGLQLPAVALYPYPVTPKLFQPATWYRSMDAWQFLLGEYLKLLLTYPQILILKTP